MMTVILFLMIYWCYFKNLLYKCSPGILVMVADVYKVHLRIPLSAWSLIHHYFPYIATVAISI